MLLLPVTGDWESTNCAQDTPTQYGSTPSAVSNANWPHCVLQKTGLAGSTGNMGMVLWWNMLDLHVPLKRMSFMIFQSFLML